MEYYIGIDIGTTHVKGGVFNTTTCVIEDVIEIKSPQPMALGNSKCEVSVDAYYEAVLKLINVYREKYTCCGIAFSCQLHCFLLCDRDKKPITNLITWQDTRAGDIIVQGKSAVECLRAAFGEKYQRITGTNIKLGLPLCAFYHYCLTNSVKPDTTFFTLDSYIVWKLIGENICHVSIAAATGFLNICNKTWDEEIVRTIDLPHIHMPDVVEEYRCIGEYEGMKLFPAVGDQQATICGITRGKKEEVNIVSIGTAGLASRISFAPSQGDYEVRPYIEGMYLLTVRRQIGGRNFDVLAKLVADIGEKVYGCRMEYPKLLNMLSDLIPTVQNNPIEMEMKFFEGQIGVEHGRIDNICYDNFDIGSILRAACVSTASTYKNAISKLDPAMRDQVIASGKIFRTWQFLQTAFINAFDNNVSFTDVIHESLWGLMFLVKEAR